MDPRLLTQFPNSNGDFVQTSPIDPRYNCIAWACGDDTKWYWPSPTNSNCYWPSNVPREVTLYAFIQLFQSLGYECCENENQEKGIEKIAIYVDPNNSPTHAIRQLPNGRWTSKMGRNIDLSHSTLGMSNGAYGRIAQFMSRVV